MKRLTLDIDDETHRQLRIQAATAGLTMADISRALLREYLEAGETHQRKVHRYAERIRTEPNR